MRAAGEHADFPKRSGIEKNAQPGACIELVAFGKAGEAGLAAHFPGGRAARLQFLQCFPVHSGRFRFCFCFSITITIIKYCFP